MEALPTLSKVSDLTSFPLLIGSSSHSARGCQPPPLDEDCAYLANLYGPVLDKEFGTLAWYTLRASTTLALGASGHWEAFWSD